MNEILDRKIVFSTSWFQLIEKTLSGWTAPYYALNAADYVSVLATTAAGRLLLVRQYRPAVEDDTIELPSGHVEQGESPSEAAEENCWKKLDMTPGELILLAKLVPDTGRLGIQFALRATSKS